MNKFARKTAFHWALFALLVGTSPAIQGQIDDVITKTEGEAIISSRDAQTGHCSFEGARETVMKGGEGVCYWFDKKYPAYVEMDPVSYQGSVIDNRTLNHHHIAYDFKPAIADGCGSCGVPGFESVMPQLVIERRHRYRDQTWLSSFGPGVYSNFDIALDFDDAYGASFVDLFDPQEQRAIRLTGSGTFDDTSNRYKDIDTYHGLPG